jgi:hypothetical protein
MAVVEAVLKARHSAPDAEACRKYSFIIMGLRVKPAMTLFVCYHEIAGQARNDALCLLSWDCGSSPQ